MWTLLTTALAASPLDNPPPAATPNPRHHAIVVYVSNAAAWSPLPAAAEDAAAFRAHAVATLGVPSTQVTVLPNPTVGELRAELAESRPSAEVVWVYFAGHAVPVRGPVQPPDTPRTRQHLVLADTPSMAAVTPANTLAASDLVALVGGKDVRVVLDACDPGTRAMVPIDAPVSERAVYFRGTQAGEFAATLPGTRHGAFSYYFLGALRGWADGEIGFEDRRGPRDNRVTVYEATTYVRRKLAARDDLNQTSRVEWLSGRSPDLVLSAPSPSEEEPAEGGCANADPGEILACLTALRDRVAAERTKAQAEATAAWQRRPADPAYRRQFDAWFVTEWLGRHVQVDGVSFPAAPAELLTAWEALGKGVVPEPVRGAVSDMVKLPGGSFFMGRFGDEGGGDDDESPHLVTVGPFELANRPVTNGRWKEVMGSAPALSCWAEADRAAMAADDLPVTCVSWCDAVRFLNAATLRLPGHTQADLVYAGVEQCEATDAKSVVASPARRGLRLPTEAEREYAARAGTRDAWAGTHDEKLLKDFANYDGDADGHARLMPVYGKRPNRFGLFGMSGNVWEWCADWYGPYELGLAPPNPLGAPDGTWKVLRGGSWGPAPAGLRVADRDRNHPGLVGDSRGFRPARSSR